LLSNARASPKASAILLHDRWRMPIFHLRQFSSLSFARAWCADDSHYTAVVPAGRGGPVPSDGAVPTGTVPHFKETVP
jgi:hypothetical protein